MIELSVVSRFGPEIEREPVGRRYYCLHYPCGKTTRLFHRPSNSHLCAGHIREVRQAARKQPEAR